MAIVPPDGATQSRRYRRLDVAVEQQQIGLLERGKSGMIADADVALDVAFGPHHRGHREFRRHGAGDQHLASALRILAQGGRRPTGGDDYVELALAHPLQVVGNGEGDVHHVCPAEENIFLF